MRLILSTSNIVGGSSAYRPISSSKSNLEFVSSLRANFEHHAQQDDAKPTAVNGSTFPAWTKHQESSLQIPALDFADTGLEEEQEQYDVTLKLFFLPGSSVGKRESYIREAVRLVLEELHVESVDLLIVSFPGIYFDEEEDSPTKISTRGPVESVPEPLADQVSTWKLLEKLHSEGIVRKLGVAEFGHDRLQSFLSETTIRPGVNQINLRDCCSVPADLMKLSRTEGIDLLVHNDCSNILPRGTVRELLGPEGAGVLPEHAQTGEKRKLGETASTFGEVNPQWVVKYTAVVRNRGVVESKGYFAEAELEE